MIRKVLFVDDDQILQLAIEKRLAAYRDQFTLILANDGFDAVKKLEKNAVSLICMDLIMPRMDGVSLLAHVREKYPDLPVIIVSSMSRDKAVHLIESKGVVGHFKKPFQATELGEKILEALRDEAKGGIMHNVSPVMFMQLMEMEGKTCTIRMLDNGSTEGGILYLRDGDLLDARVGERTGVEAAYKVFSWEEVTVFFRSECEVREKRINSELQSIIMGALAAKDELDESPSGNAEGSPAALAEVDSGDLGLPLDMLDLPAAETQSGSGVRELLQQEFSGQEGIDAVYYDEKKAPVLEKLDKLGTLTGSGCLKAAHVTGGQGKNRIIAPGEPPIVLDVKEGAAIEKIMMFLQQNS